MTLLKAIRSFLNVLIGGETCLHARTNLVHTPRCCPDCGDRVKIQWAFTICNGCDNRRIAQRSFLGKLKPAQEFCRHCGSASFRISKKDSIEAYELVYAISLITTDYTEAVKTTASPAVKKPFVHASIQPNAYVDAEFVYASTLHRPVRNIFKKNVFNWQTHQNAARYGQAKQAPAKLLALS